MSSQTRLGGLGLDLAIGRRRPSLGNQFIFHISIDSHVPIRRIMPCERTSFPSMTACHILDGRVSSLSSKKFPLGKYTDLRIRALNDPGSCSTRHAFRGNKTRLNNSISRNPQTSTELWHHHVCPRNPARLPLPLLATSPKLLKHTVDAFAESLWERKA